MNAACPCADPTCARCGADLPVPVVIWSDDAPEPDRPPPRTVPPRHGERAAFEIYKRVASRRPRPRRRVHRRGIAVGIALLVLAAVTYHFDWDVALLRLGAFASAGFGLMSLLKGLLGYGPER